MTNVTAMLPPRLILIFLMIRFGSVGSFLSKHFGRLEGGCYNITPVIGVIFQDYAKISLISSHFPIVFQNLHEFKYTQMCVQDFASNWGLWRRRLSPHWHLSKMSLSALPQHGVGREQPICIVTAGTATSQTWQTRGHLIRCNTWKDHSGTGGEGLMLAGVKQLSDISAVVVFGRTPCLKAGGQRAVAEVVVQIMDSSLSRLNQRRNTRRWFISFSNVFFFLRRNLTFTALWEISKFAAVKRKSI